MIKNEIGAYHTYSKEHIIGITENRTAHINIKAQDNKKALKIEFANGIFDISDPDVPEKITIHSEDFNIVINTKDFAAFGANEYTVFEILSSANDGEKMPLIFAYIKAFSQKKHITEI